MKQLTQAIFDGAPDWVKSAAVNPDGDAWFYSVPKSELKIYLTRDESQQWKCVGIAGFQVDYIGNYDASNWKNSAIDREVSK